MLLNHLARRVIGLANFVPSEMFASLQTALGQRSPVSIYTPKSTGSARGRLLIEIFMSLRSKPLRVGARPSPNYAPKPTTISPNRLLGKLLVTSTLT
jgi:hypothetical protein